MTKIAYRDMVREICRKIRIAAACRSLIRHAAYVYAVWCRQLDMPLIVLLVKGILPLSPYSGLVNVWSTLYKLPLW